MQTNVVSTIANMPNTESAITSSTSGAETISTARKTVSHFQAEANRSNSRKSTGPRTPEGKLASAQNARTTHGLCCTKATHLPSEDPDFVDSIQESLVDHFGPGDAFEEDLVNDMAAARIGTERCRLSEAAALADSVQKAQQNALNTEIAEAELLVEQLPESPRATLSKLKQRLHGCRALRELWLRLKLALETQHAWTTQQLGLALNLLGIKTADLDRTITAHKIVTAMMALTYRHIPHDTKRSSAIAKWMDILRPKSTDPLHFHWLIDELLRSIPEQPQAHETLTKTIATELQNLDELIRDHEANPPDPAHVEALALLDTTKDGALRMRYMNMHERNHRNAMNQLLRARKEADREEDRVQAQAQPPKKGPKPPARSEAKSLCNESNDPEAPKPPKTPQHREPDEKPAQATAT